MRRPRPEPSDNDKHSKQRCSGNQQRGTPNTDNHNLLLAVVPAQLASPLPWQLSTTSHACRVKASCCCWPIPGGLACHWQQNCKLPSLETHSCFPAQQKLHACCCTLHVVLVARAQQGPGQQHSKYSKYSEPSHCGWMQCCCASCCATCQQQCPLQRSSSGLSMGWACNTEDNCEL